MKKRICFLTDSIFSIGGVQRVSAVIASALSREYEVTFVTFDNPKAKDTSLYGLKDAPIHYRFFSYPKISKTEKNICKSFSWAYMKLQPQSRWMSRLYGYSSFPPTLRKALTKELQDGHHPR